MNVLELYKDIMHAMEISSTSNSSEPKIVKQSIDHINKIEIPSIIKIKTGFCHQKPYAILIDPSDLYNKKRTELGDFLFVIKRKQSGVIVENRGLFFQAKLDKNFKKFKVKKHQFYFYANIEKIIFKFGNNVYKKGNVKPIIWKK